MADIKLICGNYEIQFESATWSGTDTQVCRQLQFSVPYNPYDPNYKDVKVKLGDLCALYEGNKQLFVGTITSSEQKSEIGPLSFTAKDYMVHLLRSNGTFNFKNTTAEAITRRVCQEIGISTSNIAETRINIASMLVQNTSYYDIILKAYTKAYEANGIKYMPTMQGPNLSIIEKGQHCGYELNTKNDISSSSFTQNVDNMVNKVVIYNEGGEVVGVVSNDSDINSFGIYQQVYDEEEGVNAKSAATKMLVGITRNASLEAIGNTACVSGKSISINDNEAGLTGIFWITSDSHSFSNGVHTMSLTLSFNNTMETSEYEEKE